MMCLHVAGGAAVKIIWGLWTTAPVYTFNHRKFIGWMRNVGKMYNVFSCLVEILNRLSRSRNLSAMYSINRQAVCCIMSLLWFLLLYSVFDAVILHSLIAGRCEGSFYLTTTTVHTVTNASTSKWVQLHKQDFHLCEVKQIRFVFLTIKGMFLLYTPKINQEKTRCWFSKLCLLVVPNM